MLRDVIERFTGSLRIWRRKQRAELEAQHLEREARDTNPYALWLWIIAALLAWDIYKFVALHRFDWRSVQFSILSVVFLLTYFLSPGRAWLMFLICGVIAIVESPTVYWMDPRQYSPRFRLIAALLYAAIGVGAFFYGFVIRRRYDSFCAHRQAGSRPRI
jgi:ABC-type iron transport system FetAB permease component